MLQQQHIYGHEQILLEMEKTYRASQPYQSKSGVLPMVSSPRLYPVKFQVSQVMGFSPVLLGLFHALLDVTFGQFLLIFSPRWHIKQKKEAKEKIRRQQFNIQSMLSHISLPFWPTLSNSLSHSQLGEWPLVSLHGGQV
ncbi:unnamed protein product [Lepidochelys kempii]